MAAEVSDFSSTTGQPIRPNYLDLDNGTTTFMFLATCLVQFMTPGLAFFYSGMVSSKSTVVVMGQSFVTLGLIFTLWIVCIFSLTFGSHMITIGKYHFLGNPWEYFMLHGVHVYQPLQRAGAVVAPGFPGMLFMAYQGMFAVITPALISGAFVDRYRFGPYLIFLSLWMFVVYAPLGHWNWGGGWMFQYGAWDFAGGMVVHEAAGFSALGALLALGSRDRPEKDPSPHNLPFVMLGTGLLWFGWFGFNGGSALTIGGLATIAFVNTQIAPAVGMLTWVFLDLFTSGKPNIMGASAGTITGLVVITPSAGFVQPHSAMLAGWIGACVCFASSWFIKNKTRLDDTCDTLGVHGMGGFLGTIFVGVLADGCECTSERPPIWCANPGTVCASTRQFVIQLVCAIVAAVYSAVATYILFKVMANFVSPLKTAKAQRLAQDEHEFGETAYRMEGYDNMKVNEEDSVDVESSTALSSEQQHKDVSKAFVIR